METCPSGFSFVFDIPVYVIWEVGRRLSFLIYRIFDLHPFQQDIHCNDGYRYPGSCIYFRILLFLQCIYLRPGCCDVDVNE
jgi:hypothetical protein